MSRLLNITADDRLLVIAPHPDDEVLAAGGIIQRARDARARVHVVFITDGDNNPWPQRAIEHRWKIGPSQRAAWGARRREEAIRAIQTLGLSRSEAVFCGLPDQGITDKLRNDQRVLPRMLQAQFEKFAPTIVIGPSIADHHSDHSATSVRIRTLLPSIVNRPQLFEYMIHGNRPAGGTAYVAVPLSPQQMAVKAAALRCHRSQMTLSRRRLMACVRESEVFCEVAAADWTLDRAIDVQTTEREWKILLPRRRWFDRCSKATLELLVVDRWANVTALSTNVATRWGRVNRPALFDRRSGKILSRGFYDSAGRLVMPAPGPLPGDQLYVKRSGGIAFFDEAGWTPIALKQGVPVESSIDVAHNVEHQSVATATGTHSS